MVIFGTNYPLIHINKKLLKKEKASKDIFEKQSKRGFMQLYTLHPRICKLNKYVKPVEELPQVAKQLKEKLEHCRSLRQDKISWGKIQSVVGISRSSYFRIKKQVSLLGIRAFISKSKKPHNVRKSKIPQEFIDLILKLRKENPTYGKSKIVVILRRDHGINISESSVGRILSKLIKEGKAVKYHKTRYSKRKRRFIAHAKRWKYGMKAKVPGEMVQIDHMSVSKNNIYFKHFQAWDPITKTIVAEVTSNAKSLTAAKFLRKVIKELPFELKSIQQDFLILPQKRLKDFSSVEPYIHLIIYF